MMLDVIQKYLDRYAVGTPWRIQRGEGHTIDTAVVIPALAESERLFRTIASIADNPLPALSRTMVICVINNRDKEHGDRRAFDDNQKTLRILGRLIEGTVPEEGDRPAGTARYLRRIAESGLRLAVIDASSPGREMPHATGGVGFARKIGMDNALALLDYENGAPRIMLSLDADTVVAPNYLDAVRQYFTMNRTHAAVVEFTHGRAANLHEQAAIFCYEIFLRYYVLGLMVAGSPYAFHSIGSTMACTAEAYVAVRGMNRRQAGEDFYFLNKLAKLGPVGTVRTTIVHPAPRRSDRVPFGTGKRIARFIAGGHEEYRVYDPGIFLVVRDWLRLLTSWDDRAAKSPASQARAIHSSLEPCLRELRFDEAWHRLKLNSTGPAVLQKHLRCWFDGFKTLKLINALSRTAMPPVEMFEAVRRVASFLDRDMPVRMEAGEIPSLDDQQAILDCLRDMEKGCGKKGPAND
jgi:hypothetical protein